MECGASTSVACRNVRNRAVCPEKNVRLRSDGYLSGAASAVYHDAVAGQSESGSGSIQVTVVVWLWVP